MPQCSVRLQVYQVLISPALACGEARVAAATKRGPVTWRTFRLPGVWARPAAGGARKEKCAALQVCRGVPDAARREAALSYELQPGVSGRARRRTLTAVEGLMDGSGSERRASARRTFLE